MKGVLPLTAGVAAASFLLGIVVDRWILRPTAPASAPAAANQSSGGPGTGSQNASNHRVRDGIQPFGGSIEELREIAISGSGRPDDHEIRQALENTSVVDTRRLLDDLAATPDDAATPVLQRELYRRLAELDPTQALDLLLTREDSFRLKAEVIHEVFRVMAAQDFEAAKTAFARIENHDLRHRAIEGMSHAMENGDRTPVAEFINTLPDARDFDGFFHEWAIHQPGEATAFVTDHASEANRGNWLHGIGSGLALANPSAALEWANAIEDPASQNRAMRGILDSIAHTDPETAASLVMDHAGGHHRRHLIERISSQWGRENPEAAVAWATGLTGRERTAALEHIIEPWTQRDPAAAGDFVSSMPISDRTLDAMHHVAHRWSESDAPGALEWAQSQPDPRSRERAIAGIASRLAEGDPPRAAEFASSFEDPSDRRSAIDTVARHWANQDLESAAAWAASLEGQDRRRATHAFLDEIAEHDPNRAAGHFNRVLDGADESVTDHLPHVAGHIASRWSESHPAEAAQWATTLPDGDIQRRAVEEISERWIRNDARAASEWIDQLPTGESRDHATERLVHELVRDDPAAAFEWAASVGSQEHQNDLMRHALHHWNQRDPNAARAGLDAAGGLTQDQRAELGSIVGRSEAAEE